ncbi:ARM repeat-containing protein [Clavulina sp. PMI_390]|nr:ARM repeat-containing protein [Clavulina sp. PMI_390]
MSALASARIIDDISKASYPEGIKSPAPELNANAEKGKYRYDRDFLMQFFKVCQEKPDAMSDLEALGIVNNGEPASMVPSRGPRARTGSSMGPARASSVAGLQFGAKNAFGGAMGSFNSSGSKATSADRFAASNSPMSRSVSTAGMNRGVGGGAPTPMSRSSSQGGVGALPHSPKDAHATTRTRSSRGGRRSDKPGGAPNASNHFSTPSMSTIGLEPVVPLESTENRWVPTSVNAQATKDAAAQAAVAAASTDEALVIRKVKALLNKLTPEKFDSIAAQILEWANKSVNERDGHTLMLVIRLVFDKATDEAPFSHMYAKLCRLMYERISPQVMDESVKNNAGQPITGGHLFRKYLLNRCQEDFQRGWAVREATAAAAAGKAAEDNASKAAAAGQSGEEGETVLYSDEYYAAEKAKRRGLGLVKFIGELFKLDMLTERIMHECIKQLLSNIENPEEEDIESLCRLLNTVGQAMDTDRARDHMNVYFSRMSDMAKNPKLSSRVQFMIQDVIELRSRKWQSRTNVAAPSTIAQIHAEAAKDQAMKEQQAYNNRAAYPNNVVPMSRTGSRRGGQRGEETTQDGWAVAGSANATRVQGSLANFGKIGKATPAASSSNPFDVYARKNAKGRESAPPLSRAGSNANMTATNMFSALNSEAPADAPATNSSSRAPSRKPSVDLGPGGVPEAPAQRKKLVLAPRTVPNETAEQPEGAVAEEDSAEPAGAAGSAGGSTMTEAQADARVSEDVKEFWNGRNVEEGKHYFTVLPAEFVPKLISKLAFSALEKKADEVKLVADLFTSVAGETCSEDTFVAGMLPLVEGVDDLSVDVPKAYTYIAQLLRGTNLPLAKVKDLSTKVQFEGDPLVPPSKRLMKEYEKL